MISQAAAQKTTEDKTANTKGLTAEVKKLRQITVPPAYRYRQSSLAVADVLAAYGVWR